MRVCSADGDGVHCVDSEGVFCTTSEGNYSMLLALCVMSGMRVCTKQKKS